MSFHDSGLSALTRITRHIPTNEVGMKILNADEMSNSSQEAARYSLNWIVYLNRLYHTDDLISLDGKRST